MLTVNQATREEGCNIWVEFYNLIEIVESPPRLTNFHPARMSTEIGVSVCRILIDPLIHNTKIALRIGLKNFMQRKRFVRRYRFFY
jgi:hypothetical protein